MFAIMRISKWICCYFRYIGDNKLSGSLPLQISALVNLEQTYAKEVVVQLLECLTLQANPPKVSCESAELVSPTKLGLWTPYIAAVRPVTCA